MPAGVTAARMVLGHVVEVRILGGQRGGRWTEVPEPYLPPLKTLMEGRNP